MKHPAIVELEFCIFNYLQEKATSADTEVTFYSDNCVG